MKEKSCMQLKKIILKGFKSFPDKTELEFDEGVTAIVGPNGSGKSNIIEAVRWVMGEQSAKTLRGGRMNDVIFSGTDQRKPLNIAEVELILDNSNRYLDIDFEELSILRRLSRTGQSTYMINNQECRLKDIVDLFMDSGLGKESFSVISQGKVEAIFNSKPKDRRGIFEEAAGVFKYKVRKEDAKKKLDETQDNLDRVQDILYELESQLEPLREQSDVARSYLDHREKLTDLDIGVSVWQIENLTKEIDQDKAKQAVVLKDLVQIEKDIQQIEETKRLRQEELAKIGGKSEQLNEEILQVVREKERIEASLNLYDEKSRHREEFIQQKKESIQALEDRNTQLAKERQLVETSYTEQKEQLASVQAEIEQLDKKRSYLEGNKNTQMEELRNQYITNLQKQTSLKNEQSYLEQELGRTEREKQKITSNLAELKEQVTSTEAKVEQKNTQYEDTSQKLTSLLTDYQLYEEAFTTAKHTVASHRQELSKSSTDLERAKAKASSLTEMQESYSGYYAGVRAVMQAKNQLSGIVGTVAELVTIPKDYVLAIDTVLGSSGQFIIVENEKNGRDAIGYLKRKKRGRATFLPLTTIRPRHIPNQRKDEIKAIPGYLGIASELVSNDAKVQTIIDNLLGQTIVAASLEEANTIARSIQFRNRVVSLEGDVINAGGSMTGGGQQNRLNPIFSQKAELERLEVFIQKNEKIMQELVTKERQAEQERITLEQTLEEIRSAIETKRLAEQQLKSEQSNFTEELYRLKRELKVNIFEKKEKESLYAKYQESLEKTKGSLEEIEKKVTATTENMRLLTSEQEDTDTARNKVIAALQEIQETRNTIREELAREKTKLEHINNQLTDNKEQIKQIHLDIDSLDGELEVGSKEELLVLFEEHRQKEKELTSTQQATRVSIQEMNQIIEELTNQITQLTGRQKYLNDEKAKLDISLSKNDVRIDYLLDYLVDEYQISYEEAKIFEKLELGLADAKKRVKLLKKGIEELGPVNLNAIDEFEKVNERYQFLAGQQNDLIEAKDTLFSTMDDMDVIVEKRFKETFDQVQAEFSKVFPQMFGGGHAKLVLEDPDNLLETGIEIVAQPPGKKLTQLSLLSGGERALTAISLLFAIIQTNPIPFCILDEAEAALDDANVVRFGQYLKNFENDTQFIVITHRKGTMEHSDQLYGVTMQEKGVSKIVGVSLKEAQEIEDRSR